MVFSSARKNADESDADDSAATASAESSTSSQASGGGGVGVPLAPSAIEARYGIECPTNGVAKTIQRHAKQYGEDRVHSWIDEGVPVEAMGRSREMEEFRQRQAERPPEIPRNVEQQNEASVYRSRKAQRDDGPAGHTGVPDSVREVISSPGTQLDGDVKSGLEERLGTSLDHVQVHTGPSAQQACEQVNARAFAVGNHIAFGPGEYDPGSPEGQHLIAHEVVHTLQQPDADISMMPKTQPDLEVDPDPAAEREADEVAQRVVEGGDVGIYEMYSSDVHVQRYTGQLPSSASSGGGSLPAHQDAHEKFLDEADELKDRFTPEMPSVTLDDVKSEFGLVDEQLRMLYAEHFGTAIEDDDYDIGDSAEAAAVHITKSAIASLHPALFAGTVGHSAYKAWADKTDSGAVDRIKDLIESVVEQAQTGDYPGDA